MSQPSPSPQSSVPTNRTSDQPPYNPRTSYTCGNPRCHKILGSGVRNQFRCCEVQNGIRVVGCCTFRSTTAGRRPWSTACSGTAKSATTYYTNTVLYFTTSKLISYPASENFMATRITARVRSAGIVWRLIRGSVSGD